MRRNRSTWRWYLRAPAFVVVGLVLVLASAAVLAQTDDGERYFDETGHAIRGPFLKFFDEHGGLAIFGFPLTDEFVDGNGRLVQYFQRARFEWHPDNPEGFRVQLGLLGDELGYSQSRLGPGQIPAANNPYCRYFPETGHSVCYAFLGYFKAQGGLDVFGYPISEAITQSDRIVQYFQRAQMEWHPEMPSSQKVRLGAIGSIAFDFFKLDRKLLLPTGQVGTVTSLTVWASVQTPVTSRIGSQTVYVYVGDQHKQAIQGALVTATIHFASGPQIYTLPLTDARGLTQLEEFPFGQTRPGERVSIDIAVRFRNLDERTRTSFLPWW